MPIVTNAVVVRAATPALSEPVPRVVVPFLKVTVPVGLAPVTVAVNVTDAPEGIEFALEVRVVVVVVAPVTVRAMVVVAVRLPEVPVMVTVAVPAVAELLAVSDRTLDVVVLVGLNDAVTPLGKPDAARLTLPVNPFWSVTVMVLVPPEPPGLIVKLLGAADRVKSGGPVTVRVMVVVAVRLPEVPVTVTVAVPAVAELLAVSDRTLVVVVLVGLKDAVTPLGSPEAAKLTLPVKPPAGVTVMVLVPAAPPGVIDRLLGAAERVKLAVSGRLNSQMPRP